MSTDTMDGELGDVPNKVRLVLNDSLHLLHITYNCRKRQGTLIGEPTINFVWTRHQQL